MFFEIVALFPLFPGTNELDQIQKIHSVVGTPSPELLAKMKQRSQHMDFNFPRKTGSGVEKLIPHCAPECVDLINKLLAYNPDERLSARQALRHPYFREIREMEKRQHAMLNPKAAPLGGSDKDPGARRSERERDRDREMRERERDRHAGAPSVSSAAAASSAAGAASEMAARSKRDPAGLGARRGVAAHAGEAVSRASAGGASRSTRATATRTGGGSTARGRRRSPGRPPSAARRRRRPGARPRTTGARARGRA